MQVLSSAQNVLEKSDEAQQIVQKSYIHQI